jgi:hypothetical protein
VQFAIAAVRSFATCRVVASEVKLMPLTVKAESRVTKVPLPTAPFNVPDAPLLTTTLMFPNTAKYCATPISTGSM